MRTITTVIIILLFNSAIWAGGFSAQKRSEYISSIAQYVEWPQYSSPDSFRIALITSDISSKIELSNQLKSIKIKDKPVFVQICNNASQLRKPDLIYFNNVDSIPIQKVYNSPDAHWALIITENYPYQSSMFNFIVVDGKRKFELNDARLKAKGFKVDPLFASFAIRNKADWEKLYQQAEVALEAERKIVVQQKNLLKEQKEQIDEQKAEIAIQKKNIGLQKQQIEVQQKHIDNQVTELKSLQKAVELSQKTLSKKEHEIAKRKNQIIAQKKEAVQLDAQTLEQKQLLKQLDSRVKKQQGVMLNQLDAIERQKLIIWLFAVLSVLVAISLFLTLKAFRIKQRSNKALAEKNSYIYQQNEEISAQRDEIVLQRDEIEKQNEERTKSIEAAKIIQSAMLSSPAPLSNNGFEYFIYYRPCHIVSGDFYWITQKDNYIFITGADCTGHGVPGAFMSMLGITHINKLINQDNITETSEVVTRLRSSIAQALNQEMAEGGLQNGMDMSLCRIDINSKELQFTGANNHCFIFRDGELNTLKADKMAVGLSDYMDTPFTDQSTKLQSGDCIYLYSDGYHDQFGGEKNKKFMSKRFKQTLLSMGHLPMNEQHSILEKTMDEWMGGTEQIDDQLVIGIKVSENKA